MLKKNGVWAGGFYPYPFRREKKEKNAIY